MKLERNNHEIVISFDNSLEFADYANDVPANNFSKTAGENSWRGGTFRDAMEQVKHGNPSRVKKLFDGLDVINAMIEEEKIGEIRDVTGEYFDVADFLSGEPEVFRRDEMGLQKPVVPVYVNFGMLADVDPYIVENRGCAIVALVDELQSAGFIVDLRVVKGTLYGKKNIYCDIKVGINPVDLDEIAFLVGNPLTQRRLWFACMENILDCNNCYGYGASIEYDLSDIFSTGLSGFYFTSSSHSTFRKNNYHTLESAKSHILGMVEQFKESASQIILG